MQICTGLLAGQVQVSCVSARHPAHDLTSSSGFPAIVTKFYMETRPFLGVMKKSTYTYPMDQYDAVMAWLLKVGRASLPGTVPSDDALDYSRTQ